MLFQDVKPGATALSTLSKGWWVMQACSGFSHTSHNLPFVAHAPHQTGVHQLSLQRDAASEAGVMIPMCTHGGSCLGWVNISRLQLWNALIQAMPVHRLSFGIYCKNIFTACAPWGGEVLILPACWKPVPCMKKSPPSPNIKTSKHESSFAALFWFIAGLYTNWMLNTHQGVWLTHVTSFLHAQLKQNCLKNPALKGQIQRVSQSSWSFTENLVWGKITTSKNQSRSFTTALTSDWKCLIASSTTGRQTWFNPTFSTHFLHGASSFFCCSSGV